MPVGKGRHSPIAADDQGRVIAALLKSPEAHIGKTIPISGPVEMDHEQMAAELSEALGRKIVFQDLPIDEYCRLDRGRWAFRPTSSSISAARWSTTRTATWPAPTTTSNS